MLNNTQFAIITIKEAKEVRNGITKLLDPKGKYKTPTSQCPNFYTKLETAGLLDFYCTIETLIYDNEKWTKIMNDID